MCTGTGSSKKMDIMQITEDMQLMREKIIKTDEVFKLISEKRKEVNKSKKNYKKLISKFIDKQKEVASLKNSCKNGISRTEISYEKEIKELKTQNELLQKNYDEYVNTAQQKYQSACQEIETLNDKCVSLNQKIETFEHKEAKTKAVKKLQETLNEVKKKLKTSLSKYDDLETDSNKIISDLKQECKNLEERRNETLKQLAKARLDCDELKKSLETDKNSPIKSKLKEEIEELKTKLESLEIEQEIVNQSHESDISELRKRHEKEKKILEDQLEDFKNKFNEQVNEKEKELKNKHELEKKLLGDQINELKTKNVEDGIGKKYLEDELQELKNKIKEETNKLKETTGTQTDYEDIYNLEDIFTEMHGLPTLMSPLSSASSVNEEVSPTNIIEKSTDLIQIKDSNTEETVDISITVIPIEPPGVCSVAVGTNDILPTFQDSISQTDICTVFCEETSTKSVEATTQTIEENSTKIQSFEDDSDNNKNKIEFKSRITKKYKNNNKNRLLNTLKNSKLKLKSLLEQYISTSSKVVIVSSSILKTDFSKSKISEPKPEGSNNPCYSNCHSIRPENCCSCSCQQNLFNNRYCGQYPIYQMPWDYNHGIFYNSHNQSNYYNMKNHFKSNYKDFGVFDSSDSEEEDRNLRRVLREYKHSVIRKYKTEKYFAKFSKEKKQKNNVNLFINNRGKSKSKTDKGKHRKSPKSSRIIDSSDSEDEFSKNKINTRSRSREPNLEGCSEKSKNSGTNLVTPENIYSKSKRIEQQDVQNGAEILIMNTEEPINMGFQEMNRIPSEILGKEEEIVERKVEIQDLQRIKTPSINQQLLLRKTASLKKLSDITKRELVTPKKIYESENICSKENEQQDVQNVVENLVMSTEKPINTKEMNRIPSENMGGEEENNERTLENMDINAEEIVERKVEIQDLQRIKTPITLSKNQQLLLRKTASLKKLNDITKKELVTPKKIYESENICSKENEQDVQNVTENLVMSTEKQINSKEVNRIPSENMDGEEENNERTLGNVGVTAEEIVERKVEIQDLQRIKTPFTLSKKQQLLLRKASSLKNGSNIPKKELVPPKKIYETRSKVRNKRNAVGSSEVKYKKQKLELFGSSSDSDTSTADEGEKLENICTDNSTNKIETLRSSLGQNKPGQTAAQTKNTPDDVSFENVESNSENISVYSSNVRAKTRIAYKKPERCKPSIETQMEINESINEQTCLSNEEIITPVSNNKVFKRPGVTKSSLSNEIKPQNENDFLKNVNIDQPDLEIFDYVTYNTLERPSTSLVKENLPETRETLQQIDIGLAQKLINDFATKKLDKGLIDAVVYYLADKDPAIVARLIVNVAAKDFSQEYDKSFTPPAPLLTITQQKILVLLSHLEKNNLPNIHALFLQTIEKKLFSGTRIEVVHPLTRLYVAECKMKYEIENVRIFCCNAAYYMGDLFFPLMFIVLTIWGDILPMADSSQDIPLAVAIVHVIHLKTCQKPGYNFNNLNRLLSDYYGYKRCEHSNDEIMKKIICTYSDNYTKSAYLAIVILCKNLPNSWTYNQIKNHLLPLLDNCSDVEKKSFTISLIQRLISEFEKNTEQDFITDIQNRLSAIN